MARVSSYERSFFEDDGDSVRRVLTIGELERMYGRDATIELCPTDPTIIAPRPRAARRRSRFLPLVVAVFMTAVGLAAYALVRTVDFDVQQALTKTRLNAILPTPPRMAETVAVASNSNWQPQTTWVRWGGAAAVPEAEVPELGPEAAPARRATRRWHRPAPQPPRPTVTTTPAPLDRRDADDAATLEAMQQELERLQPQQQPAPEPSAGSTTPESQPEPAYRNQDQPDPPGYIETEIWTEPAQ